MTGFIRFWQSRDGTISVMFALLLVGLVGLAGASYDFSRGFQARAALQAAVDGAVLAAGADSTTDSAQIQQIAQRYLNDNRPPATLVTVGALTTSFDAANKTISATLMGQMPTSLMRIFGRDALNITVSSRVKRAEPGPVELVLALDTTLSMRDLVGGTRKIDALVTAATSLANTVMAWPDAKMGIVPFATAMNIGTEYKNKDWVTPRPDYKRQVCKEVDPGVKTCNPTWDPCIQDGVPSLCYSANCTYTVQPTYDCVDIIEPWNGVIGSRQDYETRIDSPTNPKYTWSNNSNVSKIMDLSSVRTTVLTKIGSLVTGGDTYIPGGLLWAWNMLTPEEPLTLARSKSAMEALGGRKVIVLMTDGMNTVRPTYPQPNQCAYEINKTASQINAVNTSLAQLCTNVKNDSIIIYTVAFDVSDASTKSLLQACASDSGNYFDVNDAAGLNAAFRKIGESMQRLRLIR